MADPYYIKLRNLLAAGIHQDCINHWHEREANGAIGVTKHGANLHESQAQTALDAIWLEITALQGQANRHKNLLHRRSNTIVELENRIRELTGRKPLDLS